jgi:hypothetical protein
VTLAPSPKGRPRVSSPGVLPDALKVTLRAYREQLLAYLQHPPPCWGCYACQQLRFWRHAETYRLICATCHPAPRMELIEEWHESLAPARPWVGV